VPGKLSIFTFSSRHVVSHAALDVDSWHILHLHDKQVKQQVRCAQQLHTYLTARSA
jgi:hypothetical protein